MRADFPPDTRGVWPYEASTLMNFATEQTNSSTESCEEINSIFRGLITELFDELIPEAMYYEPHVQHILTFNAKADASSEIYVVVVKQGLYTGLSDQIIVQDRFLGKIRDEYIYLSTDGSDGDIVKIHCGDIATQNHNIASKSHDDNMAIAPGRSEEPVNAAELEAVMALAVMGEPVAASTHQAEQLNYPHKDTIYEEDTRNHGILYSA